MRLARVECRLSSWYAMHPATAVRCFLLRTHRIVIESIISVYIRNGKPYLHTRYSCIPYRHDTHTHVTAHVTQHNKSQHIVHALPPPASEASPPPPKSTFRISRTFRKSFRGEVFFFWAKIHRPGFLVNPFNHDSARLGPSGLILVLILQSFRLQNPTFFCCSFPNRFLIDFRISFYCFCYLFGHHFELDLKIRGISSAFSQICKEQTAFAGINPPV